MAFLRTVNALVETTGAVFKRELVGDYLNMCGSRHVFTHKMGPRAVSPARIDLGGVLRTVCPDLRWSDRLSGTRLCVGACRGSSVASKPNPLRTQRHFTPAIINHNSN